MPPAAAPDLIDRLAAGWRAWALIALIALAGALPGIARLPALDRDEARFAQATRQMLATGDFVRINVQDTPRAKKPIGIHWLQAASVTLTAPFSDRDNTIWRYRLVSVLGAALAGWAAFWAGLALLTRRQALVGAGLFAAGVLLGGEAMIAKTDSMLCAATTLALAALAHLRAGARIPSTSSGKRAGSPELVEGETRAKSGRRAALIFWAALGAGVLIKGPVTPIVAGLTLGALIIWERRWDWMRPLLWPAGPALAALIVLPWMIAIGLATEGGFFAEAFLGDVAPKIGGGQEGHSAPPGYHLALLPLLIFPATFLLPAAARLGARVARAGAGADEAAPLRFLLAWAVPTFLAFEILPTKLVHYTLPTFPALALLGAAGLEAALRERWRRTMALGWALFALAGAALIAGLAYMTTFMPGDADAALRRATQAGLVGGLLFAGALAAMALVRQPIRLGLAVLCSLVFLYGLKQRVLPEARTLLLSAEISAALKRADLMPDDKRRLITLGYRETSLAFETSTDVVLGRNVGALAAARPGDAVVIEEMLRAPARDALAARGLALQPKARIEGLNTGNGDEVALVVSRVISAEHAPVEKARR